MMATSFATFAAISTAVAVGAGGALLATSMAKKDKPEAPKAPEAPSAPDPGEAEAKATDSARKRRMALAASGKTTYTSPLGSSGQANVARKKLLGR